MGMLAQAGAELTPNAEDADVIVVNTCSFIASAQQESIDTILEMASLKTTGGKAKRLVVAGCLVERFHDEIRKNIPEVDEVVGTGELEKILAAAGVVEKPRTPSPFNILTPGAATSNVMTSRPEGDRRRLQGRFARDSSGLVSAGAKNERGIARRSLTPTGARGGTHATRRDRRACPVADRSACPGEEMPKKSGRGGEAGQREPVGHFPADGCVLGAFGAIARSPRRRGVGVLTAVRRDRVVTCDRKFPKSRGGRGVGDGRRRLIG